MKLKFMLQRLLIATAFILPANFLQAQITTSSISGVVVDDQKQPVVGATIVAIHLPSGTSYNAISRGKGVYNIPNMKIGGPYKITARTASADVLEEKEGIMLTLGEDQDVSFSLKGSVTQLDEVVVSTAASSVMNSKRTGAASTIGSKVLNEIATTTRSFTDLTKLDPRNNGSLSFGGRDSRFNNITVDGSPFNNAFGLQSTIGSQASASPISLDAIEQIQISLAPYDVRQGLSTGANINAVTRSGDNEFRGSVYTFYQNNGLVGWRVGQQDVPVANFNQLQFGARVGGPIIKNKLFFFVSYEQEDREAPPSPNFVPTGSNAGGNISAANRDTLQALRDFLKTKYNYDPGPFENLSLKRFSRKINARLDWNIHRNHKLNLKFNYLKSYADINPSSSGGLSEGRSPSRTGLPFLGVFYRINNDLISSIVELNSKFSDKIHNNFSVGYTAMRDYREAPNAGEKIMPTTDIGNGSGATYTTFGYEPFSYENKLNSDIIQVQDNLTLYMGSHVVTLGASAEFNAFQNGFAPNYHGLFRFNTLTDFYNSAINGASNATYYEVRYSLRPDGTFPLAEAAGNTYSAYAQDEWMVFRGFKLTAGVRLDMFEFPTAPLNNPVVEKLAFNDGQKYSTSRFPGFTPIVSPRIGFNYDVFNNKKTQIRGGFGWFTGRIPFVWFSNQASTNGVLFGYSRVSSATATIPYTDNINAYRPASGGSATSYNLAFTQPDFKFPQIMRSNIAIDQNLGKGWILTGEFIYTQDVNAVYFDNVGLPAVKGLLNGGKDTRPTWWSSFSAAGVATASNRLYTKGTVDTPNISDAIVMHNTDQGYSFLFTVQLQKQFAKGFTANLAYTYTEAKSVNDGGNIAQSSWRDRVISGHPNANVLSNTNNLQQHRVTAYVSYEVDWLKYFKSTFSLFYTGGPAFVYSYTYAGDLNGDGQQSNDLIYVPRNSSEINLVDIKSGSIVTYSAAAQWADLDKYISNDPYLSTRRGQYAERNGGTAPWQHDLSFRLVQDFTLHIGKIPNRLQLTLDIINFLNMLNPNWGIFPATNRAAGLIALATSNNSGRNAFDADGKPAFVYNYLNATTKQALVEPFSDNTSLGSRWAVQLGIRYIFN